MRWGLWAPAKINLTLDVGELGADGYHQVDSLVLPLALADRLEAWPEGGEARLTVVGAPGVGAGPDNLVLKAATALEAAGSLTYRLTKSIPAGGGFGGGSSDAWATLALADLAAGGDGHTRPAALAPALGSDVPLFGAGGPARITGRGERVEPLACLGGLWAAVGTAGEPVQSGEAYRWLDKVEGRRPGGRTEAAAKAWEEGRPAAALALAGNDLEEAVLPRRPALAEALAGVRDTAPLAAGMTGSGNGFFALYPAEDEAEAGQAAAKAAGAGWAWAGRVAA